MSRRKTNASASARQRNIAQITNELHVALTNERRSIIEVGGLLIEAKDALDHGEWLPWLETNFGSSDRTAENYMNAARLEAKFEMVSNLKLPPTVLYLLGSKLDDDDELLFSPKAIEAILAAAKDEWVDVDRAHDIAESMRPPDPEEEEEKEAEAEAEEEEEDRAGRQREHDEQCDTEQDTDSDAILDGPPPKLPPAAGSAAADVVVPQFDKAVDMLVQVMTKPLVKFTTTAHTLDRIKSVQRFLQEVAEKIERR